MIIINLYVLFFVYRNRQNCHWDKLYIFPSPNISTRLRVNLEKESYVYVSNRKHGPSWNLKIDWFMFKPSIQGVLKH